MTNKPPGQSETLEALHPRAIRMALERVLEHRKLNPNLNWLRPVFKSLWGSTQAPGLTEAEDELIQSFAQIKDHEQEEAWIDSYLQRLLHP